MRAYVRLCLPDGRRVDMGPGDLIGRHPSAALHLDDARISEAHAMVSLRGRELHLLALRGRFAVDQRPVSEVVLRAGLELLLALDLSVRVEAVVLPEEVLAIEGDGLGRRVLSGVCSLYTRPRVTLATRYQGDAAAWIWSAGEDWRLRVAGSDPRPLYKGDAFEVDGRSFRVLPVALSRAEQARTHARGGVAAPLRIVAKHDTVHIHRVGEPVLALTGRPARILSELVSFGVPSEWQVVAGEIWPEEADERLLRRKWDINLSRLRKKLKDARVRPNLVRSDRSGHVELVLESEDRVEDRA